MVELSENNRFNPDRGETAVPMSAKHAYLCHPALNRCCTKLVYQCRTEHPNVATKCHSYQAPVQEDVAEKSCFSLRLLNSSFVV